MLANIVNAAVVDVYTVSIRLLQAADEQRSHVGAHHEVTEEVLQLILAEVAARKSFTVAHWKLAAVIYCKVIDRDSLDHTMGEANESHASLCLVQPLVTTDYKDNMSIVFKTALEVVHHVAAAGSEDFELIRLRSTVR